MLAQAYLTTLPLFIAPGTAPETALQKMATAGVENIAVVRQQEYIGMVSRKQLRDQATKRILDALDSTIPAIYGTQHVFDALQQAVDYAMDVVPVIDTQKRYLGTITRADLIRCMVDITAIRDRGDIIVLEVERQDLSVTRIANIVESSNAKLLHYFLTPVPDSTALYVNLKIATIELTPVVMSFERFGFKISCVFSDRSFQADARDHYDALMAFLNV